MTQVDTSLTWQAVGPIRGLTWGLTRDAPVQCAPAACSKRLIEARIGANGPYLCWRSLK